MLHCTRYSCDDRLTNRLTKRLTKRVCFPWLCGCRRSAVDRWDCLLLLHVLPPLGCGSAVTDAAVDFFRAELADSATVVRRIEGWLDRQLHRLWRDAEFNTAARLPRPGSDSQRGEAGESLRELRRLKRRLEELGADLQAN